MIRNKATPVKLRTILNQALIPMILVVVLPSVFLGWVAAGAFNLLSLLVGIWIITTMDLGGNALNNFADWRIDELNEKRIELHQTLTRTQLIIISFILFACSLPFLFFGHIYLKLAILAGYFLAINYSIGLKLKDSLFANYVLISVYYGPMAFLYGFFASIANITLLASVVWMAVFIFLIDMGFVITKDYEDVKGDRIGKKLTLPVVYGKHASLVYQFVVITMAFLSVVAMVLFGFINKWYLLVLISYFIALFVLLIVGSAKSKEKFHFSHNIIRFNALLCRFSLAFITIGLYKGILA